MDSIVQNIFDRPLSTGMTTLVQAIVNVVFFTILAKHTKHQIVFSEKFNAKNVLLAIACSLMLYIVLDNFIDPLLNSLAPKSKKEYQLLLEAMRQTPISTFIQACLIGPITEELIIRAYILEGLKNRYNLILAVILSTALFAALHINLGQIVSAFIGGLLLAALYLKTKSVSYSIIAHVLYNAIEFFATLL